MPLEFFENVGYGDVNPKEILRNQVKFKSILNEIKIGRNKSKDQQSTIKNIIIFFNLREEIIGVFQDYSFLLSGAKY